MASNALEQAAFADNPEPRCPVVLLLDTSGSMQGQPITELNSGLQELEKAIKADHLASLRVEVAVVTFGGYVHAIDVRASSAVASFDEHDPFVVMSDFRAPMLSAGGDTPMGAAVRQALELIRHRKSVYKQNGIDYFRPWIFLITDGNPTDDNWESAATQLKNEVLNKSTLFYAVGVEGADMRNLALFCAPDQATPLKLRGLAFSELFRWLSKSLTAVSNSKLGEMTPLPPVSGWSQADTSI